MARLKKRPVVDHSAGQWPAWIESGPTIKAQCPETWRLYSGRDPGAGPERDKALVQARGRWVRAVMEWCEQHGVERRQVRTAGCPRWE